jgi:hypothetical protein
MRQLVVMADPRPASVSAPILARAPELFFLLPPHPTLSLPFVCTYVHHADVPLPLSANWLASCRVPGFFVVCTLMSSLSHLQRSSVSQQSSFCLVTPRPRGPCHDDQDNLRRALVTWPALRRTLADDPKTNVGTRLAASERSDRNWLRICRLRRS